MSSKVPFFRGNAEVELIEYKEFPKVVSSNHLFSILLRIRFGLVSALMLSN